MANRRKNYLPDGVRYAVWEKTNGRCWYCGVELVVGSQKIGEGYQKLFSVDHVVPPGIGGSDHFDNLLPCCKRCNSAKSDRSLEDFRFLMYRRRYGIPPFSKEQIEYLESKGFSFGNVESFQFWGEINV